MEVPRPLKVILVRKCSSEWTNSKIEEIDKILSVRFQVKFTENFKISKMTDRLSAMESVDLLVPFAIHNSQVSPAGLDTVLELLRPE